MISIFRPGADGWLEAQRPGTFPLERDLQRLCEANLGPLFGLELVRSEFPIEGFRIDTLAFDSENSAFVIIEYKRGSSISVIDQGFAYLNVMHSNPAEFVLEYMRVTGRGLQKDDVDWSRSRVYFVAPSFTSHQKRAVNFKDLPIDLWEVTTYGSDLIVVSHVGDQDVAPPIAGLPTGTALTEETKRARKSSLEDHLRQVPSEIRRLYERLRETILEWEDVEERPIQVAILFEVDGEPFAEAILQKRSLVVHLDHFDGNSRGLHVRDFIAEGKGRYWAVGDYQIRLNPGDDVRPVAELARTSYEAIRRSRSG